MTADHLRRCLPSTYRVAALAIRAKLAPVKIRVTIRAFHRSLGKNFRYVARITRNIFMHASQGKARLRCVTELRLRAQRSPTSLRMAILACDVERSMRVANGLRGGELAQPSKHHQRHGHLHPSPAGYFHLRSFRPHHPLR
jgi:hypothetical protein